MLWRKNEPSKYRLVIEDTAASARFLTVMQGADAGVQQSTASHFVSTDGVFDGSIVGNIAVLFPHKLETYSTVTYRVPPQVTGHYITGLFPNSRYDVKQIPIGSGDVIVVTPGSTYRSDTCGVLRFGQSAILSVDENVSGIAPDKPGITLYPNPVIDRLLLNAEGVNVLRYISIFNILGKEQMRFTSQSNSVSIDCSKLPPGIYICRIGRREQMMLKTFFVRR